MNASIRASITLAAAFVCAFSWGAGWSRANPRSLPDGVMPSPTSIAAVMEGLEDWLDRESSYKRRDTPVTVQFIGAGRATRVAAIPTVLGAALRGYYDPQEATIFLVEPWSPDSPFDVSILLHELVHHRQQSATYWECPNAQERPAYRLQEQWLRQRGLDPHFNRLVVLTVSRCRSGPFDDN